MSKSTTLIESLQLDYLGDGIQGGSQPGRAGTRPAAPAWKGGKKKKLALPAGLVKKLILAQGGQWFAKIEIYPEDVKVQRKMSSDVRPRVGGGKREIITMLSSDSARRMKFTARNLVGLKVLLTLTYPREFPMDGKASKQHLKMMQQWLSRRGVSGFWFLEFQDRGAPHYHLFLTDRAPFTEVAAAWYRIVGSGDPRHLAAGTRIESIRQPHAAAAYAAKYASKQVQKQVPEGFENVGRFWGLFGGLKPVPVVEIGGEVGGDGPRPGSPVVDPDTGEQVGEVGPGVVQAVRVLRGLQRAWRRSRGLRPWRDNGRFSFTAWSVGRAAAACLPRMGHAGVT